MAATRRGPKRSTAAPPTSDASAIPSDAAPHTMPPIACEIPSSFAMDGMSGGSTDHPSPPPTACAIAQSAVVRPAIVRSMAHLSLRRNTTGAPPSMSPSSPRVKANCCIATWRARAMFAWWLSAVVKKYGNRRLYDTGDSRYITLEELAEKIRKGADVQVVDAKSGQDLTQATLTQIIVESRGAAKLLPVPLLLQLIRMREDALAEFMGRWMSWALAVYTQARAGRARIAAVQPARHGAVRRHERARAPAQRPRGLGRARAPPPPPSPAGGRRPSRRATTSRSSVASSKS